MHYVFLYPDGGPQGLAVIVHAKTGVVYANQCDGRATDLRRVEGFFIPLRAHDAAPDEANGFNVEAALTAFFDAEFRGHPYRREEWTHQRIDRLAGLVARVPIWLTESEGEDKRLYLALDITRIDEATEAWVPVRTPYGPGTLVFENCD